MSSLSSPDRLKTWQRLASPLARWACFAYALLVIDASLFPWRGWRDRGIGVWDYLRAGWPNYFTGFDVAVNVLGYVPFGALLALALYPRLRGVAAVLVTVLAGALLAAGLEALQTWLPARVPSLLDLAANTAGSLIGAVLGARLAEPVLERGRLRELRARWFVRGASAGLIITGLWFLALMFPDRYAFAPGAALKPLFDAVLLESGWQDRWRLDPRAFVWGEAALTAAAVGGAGALLLTLTRRGAPRWRIALVFIVLSVLAQTLSAGMSTGSERPFAWLTAGVQWGLVVACGGLGLLAWLPPVWRARFGVLALAGLILTTGLLPANPYFAAQKHWAYGQFLNFYGLTLGIHLIWPLLGLITLLPRVRTRSPGRPL